MFLARRVSGRLAPQTRLELRRRLRRLRRPAWLGTVRRTRPLSDNWGYDRGNPVDRYYVERFLSERRRDIRGHVLEVKDPRYTDRFGADLTGRDILDVDPANPRATIVADLAAADAIPSNRFDCFILAQTLQYVVDVPGAIVHAHRILRPGGVLLVTVPCVSRIDPDYGADTDRWRFTPSACAYLFGRVFDPAHVEVRAFGNVLTNVAFLLGMASNELSPRELDEHDRRYPLLVTVRAVKA